MNRYDKEDYIIEDFQELSTKEIYLLNNDISTRKVLESIHKRKQWRKWVNSSSKKSLPPDFYNDQLGMMMDVMRVDDHSFVDHKGNVINPTLKRESQLIKEMIQLNPFLKKIAENGDIIVSADSGLRGEKDHNYKFYCEGFNRVVDKHVKKIKNYKKNHPGYKMIFFILDESSPYMVSTDSYRPRNPGEIVQGELHRWWSDYEMLKCFINSDVDYLIWFSPYKHFESVERIEPPFATIFDVKRIDYNSLIHYSEANVFSMEA